MKFKSHYPPLSYYGDVSKRWYIIADGKWNEVDRKYSWEELEKMWERTEVKLLPKNVKVSKKEYIVNGSKGNLYSVVDGDGFWSCSCPAHGFSRGKDCKHIKQIKDETSKKTNKRKGI